MATLIWSRCRFCQKVTKDKPKCPSLGTEVSVEKSLATYQEFLDNYEKLKLVPGEAEMGRLEAQMSLLEAQMSLLED